MKTIFCRLFIGGWVSFLALCLNPVTAQADTFLFQFGDVFSGDGPVSTNRPWVQAMFKDISPGVVQISVSNLNLTANENLDEFYLNLNTNLNPLSLSINIVGQTGNFDAPVFSKGV